MPDWLACRSQQRLTAARQLAAQAVAPFGQANHKLAVHRRLATSPWQASHNQRLLAIPLLANRSLKRQASHSLVEHMLGLLADHKPELR